MQAGVRSCEKNASTVVDHGKSVNILRLQPVGASFPPFAAVNAPPRAVDFHPGPDERRISGIEHDLRYPCPVFPPVSGRVALGKRVVAQIVAGQGIRLHRHAQVAPALARVAGAIEPRGLRPGHDYVGIVRRVGQRSDQHRVIQRRRNMGPGLFLLVQAVDSGIRAGEEHVR